MTSVDDQLRHAAAAVNTRLHGIAPEPRLMPSRRQHRRMPVVIAVLAGIALVAVVVFAVTTSTDHHTAVVARPSESQIIADKATANGARSGLTVLSRDGYQERLLDTVPPIYSTGRLSVTANGRVMYATADPVAPGGLCPRGSATPPDVVRISTIDGHLQRVTLGSRPIVSRDGRRLAYNPGSCRAGRILQLTIMNIRTGATSGVPRAVGRSLGRMTALAWSPNGSRLLVATATTGNPKTDRQGGARLLIVKPIDWNAAPVKINVPGPIKNATYLNDGRVLVQYLDPQGIHQFVAIDPASRTKELLFQSKVPDSGAIGPFEFSLSADPSGRVLVTYEQGALQTWTPGDVQPTTLAQSNVPFAAWLPVAHSAQP